VNTISISVTIAVLATGVSSPGRWWISLVNKVLFLHVFKNEDNNKMVNGIIASGLSVN
jgi:hypothetical protein